MIEIINHEEGIAMAVETMSKITQDQVEYARMCNLLKSELDYQSGMVDARREGREEGREEGRKEAVELFEQGLSLEEIKQRLMPRR